MILWNHLFIFTSDTLISLASLSQYKFILFNPTVEVDLLFCVCLIHIFLPIRKPLYILSTIWCIKALLDKKYFSFFRKRRTKNILLIDLFCFSLILFCLFNTSCLYKHTMWAHRKCEDFCRFRNIYVTQMSRIDWILQNTYNCIEPGM